VYYRVIDGSWSFDLNTGKHTPGITLGPDRKWRVLYDCQMTEPSPMFIDDPHTNDCVIEACDNGQLVSIQRKFLWPYAKSLPYAEPHCKTCQCR
jgi:hypothetical protein